MPVASPAILESIHTPSDVRDLAPEQLEPLAAEIREAILEVVATNGGHLASNLGTVELTIALLRAFDLERDALVWDTGHQAYAYKLLTGRRDLFESLRQDGGCGAFLNRNESKYDVFGAGHAGTALSAALGFAAARDQRGETNRVVAVVGDGALGSGVALEGMNSIVETTRNFTLVLNDNRMSIAPNVGAWSQYLNRTISNLQYRKIRRSVADGMDRIPGVGPALHRWFRRLLLAAKGILTPGAVFEELGLTYIGPLDGHDIPELARTFAHVQRFTDPVIVHVLTEKGHGYSQAVEAPETYHGLGRFDVRSGEPDAPAQAETNGAATFSGQLGESLCAIMREDPAVVAVTAGMCYGTGLTTVRNAFPERLFDVGIAEEHAAVFAAGLAAAGMKPVVAIYATFMQRAFDYVFHDILLQNLPVLFCLDRAGVVDDGPTHHGIQDLAWWTGLPGLAVLQPADAPSLDAMVRTELANPAGPTIVRYPKGDAAPLAVENPPNYEKGRAGVLRAGDRLALWALGREVVTAMQAAEILARDGLECTVVDVRTVQPLDADLLRQHVAAMPVVTLENHYARSGLGDAVRRATDECGDHRLLAIGWPWSVIPGGTEKGLREAYGMTPEAVAAAIADFANRGGVAP